MAIDLSVLESIDGFIGACIVDAESAMTMGLAGGSDKLDLETAAAGNSEVVKAKRQTIQMLKLGDRIEDILISLDTQYHLIRPLESNDAVFIYLALDRSKANLAMARVVLRTFEKTLEL